MAMALAAGFALTGAAGADPDASPERKLGGQCGYAEHPGTCTILSVEKTPDSIAQASLKGGPGYEGLAVMFAYAGGDAAGGDALVQQAIEGRHELRLMNSWFPGPRFLDRYGIAAGKSFECTLKVITQGTAHSHRFSRHRSRRLFRIPALIAGNLCATSQQARR
jgi:hypothetical protein